MQSDSTTTDQTVNEELVSRRTFLTVLSYALGAFAAAIASVPVIGFLLAPQLRKPEEVWRSVGKVGDFTIGNTVEVSYENPAAEPWAGVTGLTAAYLRRDGENSFKAFSINCTHLGCPVRWLSGANLFMCPCHGSVFDQEGVNVAGPAPQPLVQYPVRVNNGEVEIQTSPLPIIH